MAFPLPEHLPRAAFAHEGTSFGSNVSHAEPFLKKMAGAKAGSINKALAGAWSKELQDAIDETKNRIRSRIQDDLPTFERQLESAQQVQSRLRSLGTSVEEIDDTLNGAHTGLLPNLLRTLAAHSTLAQQTQDARMYHEALSYMLQTSNSYDSLQKLVQEGHLAHAVEKCAAVRELISAAPTPLPQAKIMGDIKRKFRATEDRVQEQLHDALTSSISISTGPGINLLIISPSVKVQGTTATVTLKDILSSMSTDSVNLKLGALRKEIMLKFVDPILSRASAVAIEETESGTSFSLQFAVLTVTPPLQNLTALTQYIHEKLILSLPPPHSATFPSQLYGPITSSIITLSLVPSIPSRISDVPPFLALVSNAVHLETDLEALGISLGPGRGKVILEWSHNVGTHYEKKRREDLIQSVREIVMSHDEDGVGVRVERVRMDEGSGESDAHTTPSSIASSGVVVDAPTSENVSDAESGWDFEDDPASPTSPVHTEQPVVPVLNVVVDEPVVDQEEDGWGFDDDPVVETPTDAIPPTTAEAGAWGWDDPPLSPPPVISGPIKQATKLEKLAAKSRSISGGSATASPVLQPSASHAQASPILPSRQLLANPNPIQPAPRKPKKAAVPETCLISSVAKKVAEVAEQTFEEGQDLLQSQIFNGIRSESSTPRGTLLLLTTPSVFDLFRALYPVTHADRLVTKSAASLFVGNGMKLSNDCYWLSTQLSKMIKENEESGVEGWGKEKLEETRKRLKSMGEEWYENTLERTTEYVSDLLLRTDGFSGVGDDVLLVQCQTAIEMVVQDVNAIAKSWQSTLTHSAYSEALGSLLDDVLARIIEDIISLPDIPEMESHRLGELCKLMNPLEELFVDNGEVGGTSKVVAHVPLWLKFSYLSELLEASLADISYLFEQGALIDFEVEELVRLIRALFSETPLRAKTIEKISVGHPIVG